MQPDLRRNLRPSGREEVNHQYWNRRYWRMVAAEQALARQLVELQELLLLAQQESTS
jgi:hypothetical protein